jgi:hypothetical protein
MLLSLICVSPIPLESHYRLNQLHEMHLIKSVDVALTILSNAIVFELLSSKYPNDSINVER